MSLNIVRSISANMASSDILSQTLSSITSIKLDEISYQRNSFETAKAELLDTARNNTDQASKVKALLKINDGTLPGLGAVDTNASTDFDNMVRFLEQAKFDPSVSTTIQQEWQAKLEKQLDIHSLKYEYAALYGKLVNEWLSANVDKTAESDADMGSGFESIGRKEMHDQRQKWEDMVFTARETDTSAIDSYLTKLFSSTKDITSAYYTLRLETESFEKKMASDVHFDQGSLTWVIKGLLRSDLVTDEKRKVLKDFLNNKVVLDEIADVLNMRMSALDKWKWDAAGTPVEQRRQLNGRYRFYHDEDLLQTILLRYIGVKWSVFFKNVFEKFQQTESVWKSTVARMTPTDRERREYFLGSDFPGRVAKNGVEARRSAQFKDEIFMEQLQGDIREQRGGYDDDNEDEQDTRKSGQQITQTLLHTLATEIILKTRLNQDVTVVRTDFAWFGPSLPHSTMFAVLKFFKVSERWVNFFRRSLEAPMKFVQDGPDAPVQIRQRGTPISGPLSDFLAETVLFCLDFAFNQESNGLRLYRLHDDIWFWGSDDQCVQGWDVMTKFATLAGLDFNEEKTGSVRIACPRNSSSALAEVHPSLPQGDVRWGFLKLDSQSGRFLIDQESVDRHIEELRLQLDACKSIFDWIHVWNIYGARFFSNNFGKSSNSFGLAHVDMLLQTFARIQAKLFARSGGSVTSTLKQMLTDRFGVTDIPEGYLYFPMSMGGLDLKSPFIDLYLIRGSVCNRPDVFMDNFFTQEDNDYRRAKEAFENGLYRHSGPDYSLKMKYGKEGFFTMEEFTRYQELTSRNLARAYELLTMEPAVEKVKVTAEVTAVISGRWRTLSPYQQWVIQLYASNMIARFGGLNIVDKGLLPTGMVSMFRESRFKWQG
ncbi:hypothetical protein ONS95_005331 [Cadophora gregata]|uniref:uncharacterized protein n=2 Tax=Cadophora gregata TaxID=51156 RepID=UPI0026DCAA2D|nr:uncharacterized protein ONS95_005331 [Cadophora gregata]KAK0103301.1 hypothetical protein ONS95_005331 [Cadophora gregata]